MATTSQYTAQPTLDISTGSTANTLRDGTGTTVLAASGVGTAAPGAGKRLNRVTVKAVNTVAAGMIRFFLSSDGGTTKRLVAEQAITATTPSASVASFEATVVQLTGLILPDSNAQLYWSTNNAEVWNVHVEGGLF